MNGKITVNHNTFDVSFDNGRVSARFASGNWFTNFFRGKTMGRFTEALQTQYDNWIKEKTKASAADAGFKDNPGVPDVKKAVDECFDILYANRAKLDANTVDCSKNVMKAFAMPHSEIELDENDVERLGYYLEGKAMPPNLAKCLDRLGQIAELAAIRNELTTARPERRPPTPCWSASRSSRTWTRTARASRRPRRSATSSARSTT